MTTFNLLPLQLRADATEVLLRNVGQTVAVYAEAERIRQRWQEKNIALEDIIAFLVQESGGYNVSIIFNPAEAADALMGNQPAENSNQN